MNGKLPDVIRELFYCLIFNEDLSIFDAQFRKSKIYENCISGSRSNHPY